MINEPTTATVDIIRLNHCPAPTCAWNRIIARGWVMLLLMARSAKRNSIRQFKLKAGIFSVGLNVMRDQAFRLFVVFPPTFLARIVISFENCIPPRTITLIFKAFPRMPTRPLVVRFALRNRIVSCFCSQGFFRYRRRDVLPDMLCCDLRSSLWRFSFADGAQTLLFQPMGRTFFQSKYLGIALNGRSRYSEMGTKIGISGEGV